MARAECALDLGTEHSRPLARQRLGSGASDAAARCGNERHFARDPPHAALLCCRYRATMSRTPARPHGDGVARQAVTVNRAMSKLYTRPVLPPAILACSSSDTPARISARILRDWGKVDSLCG
jgi:hypothetical protein